jgi:hypothetical protein
MPQDNRPLTRAKSDCPRASCFTGRRPRSRKQKYAIGGRSDAGKPAPVPPRSVPQRCFHTASPSRPRSRRQLVWRRIRPEDRAQSRRANRAQRCCSRNFGGSSRVIHSSTRQNRGSCFVRAGRGHAALARFRRRCAPRAGAGAATDHAWPIRPAKCRATQPGRALPRRRAFLRVSGCRDSRPVHVSCRIQQ